MSQVLVQPNMVSALTPLTVGYATAPPFLPSAKLSCEPQTGCDMFLQEQAHTHTHANRENFLSAQGFVAHNSHIPTEWPILSVHLYRLTDLNVRSH